MKDESKYFCRNCQRWHAITEGFVNAMKGRNQHRWYRVKICLPCAAKGGYA